MKKIRILSLALALGVSSLQVSCSRDSSKEQEAPQDKVVDDLYVQIRDLEKNLSEGFLLRGAQDNQKKMFTDLLYDLKVSILRLRNNPQDGAALSSLSLAAQEFNKLSILEQDDIVLGGFRANLAETLDYLAGLQGKTLDKVDRVLFSTLFDTDLSPFLAISAENKTGWIKANHEETNYALVKGGPLNAWLVSPIFDMTNVKDPRLVLKQSINSWGKPYADAVSLMVSENYVGGDIAAANWDKIAIQRLPNGSDWGAIQTEPIDLSKYAGKKIVIGFKYSYTQTRDIPTWQLNSFKLTGSGAFEMINLDPASLALTNAGRGGSAGVAVKVATLCTAVPNGQAIYKYKFDKADLGTNFTKVDPTRAIWTPGDKYKGVLNFSGFDKNGNKVGTSWLVSKPINLKGAKDVCLSVAEEAFFPKLEVDLNVIEILVSTDYTGDATKATWKNVTIPNRKASTSAVVAENLSTAAQGIMLKDVIGETAENVTVAFRYTSTAAAAPWWGVSDLQVFAAPSGSAPLTLTGEDTGSAPVQAAGPAVAELCTANKQAKEILKSTFGTADLVKDYQVFDTLKNINLAPDLAKYPNSVTLSGFASAGPRVGTSWMVSKTLDVADQNDLCVSVAEDIFALKDLANLSGLDILVSKNYEGGAPEAATWISVRLDGRKAQTSLANKDTYRPKANGAKVSELLGQDASKLTFALRYTATADSTPWWGVSTVAITGVAKPQTPAEPAQPVVPTPTVAPTDPVQPATDNQ